MSHAREESRATAPKPPWPAAAAGAGRSPLARDRLLAATALAGGLWVAGFALATALVQGDQQGGRVVGDGLYLVPVLLCTALAWVAAIRVRGRQRTFWLLLAASNTAWAIGEALWSADALLLGHDLPFPSIADAFYLGSYLIVPVAIVVAYGGGSSLRLGRSALDCSILAPAIGLGGYLVLIRPQLAGGFGLATAVGIAYPLLGVVILVLLSSLALGGHRRVPVSVLLVAVAFAVSAVTDAAYTYAAVVHSYVDGSWLNIGWQAEAVLLCLAALVAFRHREADAVRRIRTGDPGLPAVLAGTGVTVVAFAVDASRGRVQPLIGALAVYVVVAVVLRLWLTSREKDAIAAELERALAEQQRLAVSDGLTGLHNRRFFEEVLKLETERALRSGRSLGLIVLDLDHFKLVNDRHGHPAGDEVLREAARRLLDVARGSDVVARYGGEEFVLVVPELDPGELHEMAERIRRAIAGRPVRTSTGIEIALTTSVGGACLPAHAGTLGDLVRAADMALYAAKHLGRNLVQVGTEPVPGRVEELASSEPIFSYLQSIVDEVDLRHARGEHSQASARWAGLIAGELGLSPEQRRRCIAAARFHDIGKVTLSDAVLGKPGPLSEEEWRLVHAHPGNAARILGLAPGLGEIAAIVADHHERLDGSGYPAGKRGPEIGIEARIVAVCDTWAAMTTDRPYRPARTREQARAELRRVAGTQLDPDAVAAMLRLEQAGAIGAVAAWVPRAEAA